MSTLGNDEFKWRETYFVLIHSSKQPSLAAMEETLRDLSKRFQLTNLTADERGGFEAATVLAPDEFAAIDISYVSDEEVALEAARLVEEMRATVPRETLAKIAHCDARLDVLHFEQVFDDSEEDEVFDPSALLMILSALAAITDGISVDPQSGTILS